jgi:cytochrome c oxidase assembly protein subunit 15
MTTSNPHPWLHRYAVLTAAVALLPIGMGALVTSLDAGMAFLDWPTSDGQNMFLYPWLKDFHENRDKFVEHGHRLAGSLIGLFSIGLVVMARRFEPRGWVRVFAAGILSAVVLQGLLGGFRVIADARVAALVHGLFASLIFAAITVFSLATGSKWSNGIDSAHTAKRVSTGLRFLALATPLAVLGQSLLGGLVRHLGLALHEHLAGAILAALLTVAVIAASWQSRLAWLRPTSLGLSLALLAQLVLGAGAWVTRFGFPPVGYVAVQQAPEQILFRTAHAVVAMFVLMMSVQLAARVWRLSWLSGPGLESANGLMSGMGRLEARSTLAGGAVP